MNKMLGQRQVSHIVNAYPLYLVIFCIHSPLSLLEIFPFYDRYSMVPGIALLLVASLFLFTVFRIAFRNTQFAGVASLAAIMVLLPKATTAVPFYLVIAGAGFVPPIVRLWRKQAKTVRDAVQPAASFTCIANVAAAAMIVAIGAQGAYTAYVVSDEAGNMANDAYASVSHAEPVAPLPSRPHIVHIVLDGYSRADVLRDVYGFDNKPFLTALTQRGFRIADKATTPFNQTLFVMNSIFSLGAGVASPEFEIVGKDPSLLRRALARGLQDGGVARMLHALGYELQSSASTYLPLQWDNVVDVSGHASALNRLGFPATYAFTYDLLESSPVFGGLARTLLGPSFDIISVNFRNLKEVPKRRFYAPESGPLFVYQHILAPHPPFNITADGRRRFSFGRAAGLSDGSHLIHGNENNRAKYREGYIEKLRYINAAILEQIDGLKETLFGPLVIIVHGDHGGGLHLDQAEAKTTCLNERFSPLLAVYATDERISNAITSDFNLVNIYRVVLGALLDDKLPMLPARSTFVSWELDKAVRVQPDNPGAPCPAVQRALAAELPRSASQHPTQPMPRSPNR